MVVDVKKFRLKLMEKEKTQETIADEIGIDRTTFYRKMKNGGNGFTVGEIHKIVDAVPLTKEEAISIFFASWVA